MIPLNAYPAYVRGRELYLKFLSRYPEDLLERIIGLFEEKNRSIIRRKELIEDIRRVLKHEHDLRIPNLIYYSMRVFYGLEEPKIPLILRNRQIAVKDEWDLRKIFYRWVQENYGGFIPIKLREEAINRFCSEYGIEPEKLDNILAGGILRGLKLIRRIERPPTPKELVDISNFLLLEKTLGISNYATVVFHDVDIKGAIVKDLLFRSKRARLILDFKIEDNKLVCYLSGPFQIFKHPSPIYGEGIRYVLVGALCRCRRWWLKAWVRYRKRNVVFKISSNNPKFTGLKPPWEYTGERWRCTAFDSQVEQKLYYLLSRMYPDAKIMRESDVVFTPTGRIFIPDFSLEIGDKKVYVELVGFWTGGYARKKREKLSELYSGGVGNIVAVVDKKLEKYFANASFPVVFYDSEFSIARSLRNAIGRVLRSHQIYVIEHRH